MTAPLPVVQASLAHASTDPPSLVSRARAALGWAGSDFLVGLRGYPELMATLEAAHDLEGLVRVGDPSSPPVRLLRALNASATGLRVVRVADVPSPWRWTRTGPGDAELTGCALRQQTYSDVVAALGTAGVTFRVLPDATSTDELYDLAGALGSAVVDVDELRDPERVVDGHLADLPPLSYGLVSRAEPLQVDGVWLSMAADHEASGTLMMALQQVADLGIDLQFLHSDPHHDADGAGRHDFYVGFRTDAGRVAELQERLRSVSFTSRVLAAFPA